ncbi:hypothetical protein GP486_004194 [Trichoglossum hirsutum]|uniref:CBF1-interacting co-repressor CIR N-terminal domain-containing protein n=1 Tax=Trichoglossum hirsutum TaxID=265104 RepID=A0A9P8LBL4_9PEZI|nr:hypothetical protein GP486_004194 [Trichoglossum hirsutum]
MPLHLLGKKSWNVYNKDNIDRVRRDEANARAREEEEERRMQEADAERRIQLLRGKQVDPLLSAPATDIDARDDGTARRGSKRRKLAGEDDTQRDIRLAKQDTGVMGLRTYDSQSAARRSSDAPLVGKDGHINLFPQEGSRQQVQKNPEAEAEAAKKKREFEDQYTMRFSNAAGFKQGIKRPWYSSLHPESGEAIEEVGKDVWGNDDKGRKDRERRRIENEDPLQAIRKGVSGLKEVENERRKWREERQKEIRDMGRDSRRRRKRDSYEPEDFSLDSQTRSNPVENTDGRSARKAPRHRHRNAEHKLRHSELHSSSRHERKPSPTAKDGDNDMARLRRERDEREKKERLRARALVAKAQEADKPAWVKGAGRYSTQFADQQGV